MSVCASVPLSTKSFFDFNEIWHVSRGWWWVMHDGMQYDPIHGQGHRRFKVWNLAVFKSYLFQHLQWQLPIDHWFLNYGTTSEFDHVWFVKFAIVFVSRDLNLAETSVAKSRPSVPYGANLVHFCHSHLSVGLLS